MEPSKEMERKKPKLEETICKTCGHKPKDRIEQKIIIETDQCITCIEKKEKIKETSAKMCHKCHNITYPLNTFLDIRRENWLCNECAVKEIMELRCNDIS